MDHRAVVEERANKIRSSMNMGDKGALLSILVDNPPYNNPDSASRDEDVRNVVQALGQFKQASLMEKALAALQPDEVDALTKYIYAGLALGGPEALTLLKWHHAAQTRAGGLGAIVRVMADKGAVI
eukprot:TRINITY_DN9349_c0_g1_i1.p1 TRINITY_DN9349_c0_g1~~TRINITY_DN9349_c0_g1_i1.p1  ORF type:complete len:126 (+),score=36.62 TRINITY_DN9349_c0_g1_i1:447-824(+)